MNNQEIFVEDIKFISGLSTHATNFGKIFAIDTKCTFIFQLQENSTKKSVLSV